MDVITEHDDNIQKTLLSQIKDLDILRAPISLSNYLPEIRELLKSETVLLSATNT